MSYNRHYCYKITFEDEYVYYGVRTCQCPISSDSYMGTPVTYAAKWQSYVPRVKTVISVHATRELANEAEAKLIEAFWLTDKSLSLNATIMGIKFNTFGKTHTDEAKAKMSLARKGKPKSAKTKAKLSLAKKGITHTDEAKAKMSLAKKGKPKSSEHRTKMSEAHKGTKWYTDGTVNLKLKPEDVVPKGFRLGRTR